jgi:MFS family permease
LSVLRVPAFRRLVVAWSFSNFGDSVLYLTLAIWAKDLTDSDAAAGLVFLFLGLPVFLAPFAGQLADRYSRRRIVIFSNLVAAVVVLSLWFVDGPSQMWIIYLVTFLYGLLTYVTSAAGSGLVKDMLADDQLASANGILNTIDQGLRLLSPLVGAGLYAAFGGFAISVITFVMLGIAVLVMATLRLEESPPEERGAFWEDFTAGARHIRRVPLLARMTLAMGAAFAMTGFASTTSFAVIDQGLGRPTEFYGVLAAVQGGGSILGGVTAAALIHRLGERTVVAIGLVMLGIGLGVMAVPEVWVVVACEVLVGLSIPWFVVGFVTLRQRLTPNRLQGRVSAFSSMALNGPQVGGTALGAVLIAFLDYRLLVIVMGLSVAMCALAIVPSRHGAQPAEEGAA